MLLMSSESSLGCGFSFVLWWGCCDNMRACRQHSTLTFREQHSSNKRFADLTLRSFHEVFPMVSQHAKFKHSVIITTLLNFIKDHAERAECQGEWVIVLLLSIRLQNFTKCYNTNIFLAAQSFAPDATGWHWWHVSTLWAANYVSPCR